MKKGNIQFSCFLAVLLLCSTTIGAQNGPPNGPGGPNRDIRINNRNVNHTPRGTIDSIGCMSATFRTIDGTCNNITRITRMEFGATDVEMIRVVEPQYGASDPFNAMAGEDRRSARDISNIVIDQPAIIFSSANLSALHYNWGQFLDHDITLTPEVEEEYEPIAIPDNDPLFTEEISFLRSEFFNIQNDGLPREQLNIQTAWVDGSMVYGAEEDRAEWLRTHSEGKLLVSTGNLLPFNTIDGEYDSEIDTLAPSTAGADDNGRMWIAGDLRVGEQTGLTSLHTLFVREHNRLCDELIASGMTEDEEIYQTARKKVVAIIQKITYDEFLPALGVTLPTYKGYNPNINPNIANSFATAAYRLGHTMVVDSVRMFDNDCNLTGDSIVSLIQAFFNPEIIRNYDIAPFLKGLTIEVQYEIDPYIVPELRNFLFTDPNSPIVAGLDLASLNIQRGRDHGLPDYNTIRETFLGEALTSFDQISSDPTVVSNLETAYNGDIDDIDAWVGLLCEDLVSGTSLGATLHAMMIDQFSRIRDADRYYYESYLSESDLAEVKSTSLSDVIMRNTTVTGLVDNVMFASSCLTSTSTQEIESYTNQIKVSPNPTPGVIQIQLNQTELEIKNYNITDVAGKEVFGLQPFSNEINLSNLTNGIYFLQLYSNKGVITKKIILEQ